jgi:hypothetical protein
LSLLHPFGDHSVFMGELFAIRSARSATEGGNEVGTTTGKSAAQTSRTVEVDFLYLDLTACSRCRGSDDALDAAVEITRPALESVGAGVEVRKTLVETEEQARALGFVSSPTILVNGRDVAGELIESSCSECGELCGCEGGVDCRVWDYRSEIHTEAPASLIVEAILAEAFGQPAGARGEGSPEATTPSADAPENLRRFFAGSGTSTAEEASSCCSTEEQATCCEPAEKVGCCGEVAGPSSCGCR